MIGDVPIPDIDAAFISKVVLSLREAGCSKKKIRKILTIVSAVLGVAVKWTYIDSNPMDNFDD